MNKYVQNLSGSSTETRFTGAPMSNPEFSRMTATPTHITTFNAGDIVPIYCREVLPHSTFSVDLDFVIRQTTVKTPTMQDMTADFYAFWVPNRVVNESWKNVMGENSSGMWSAPEVDLVSLVPGNYSSTYSVPVGSVADYYGFPTQAPIPGAVLAQCHDLKFRGYLEIYNTRFRDQNYQNIIPYSKLNIQNGFFEPVGSNISLTRKTASSEVYPYGQKSDGTVGYGSVQKALFGDGSQNIVQPGNVDDFMVPYRSTAWSALDKPLKANKLHDYFTSVLPSPQRGQEVVFSLANSAPVSFDTIETPNAFASGNVLKFNGGSNFIPSSTAFYNLGLTSSGSAGSGNVSINATDVGTSTASDIPVYGLNLVGTADLSERVKLSVNELRLGSSIQQVYETLARGGGRYREYINSFFGIDVDNPFCDIPEYLGHIRRDLDLYQTAQTSSSVSGGTPQGNLSAFGYTTSGGHLFTKTFVEHGYVHIFCVVRHKNVYSSMLSRDNFRLSMLDFYAPQLANLAEQPVYTREINPFVSVSDSVFGYQEAWAEYRQEPSSVSGFMRPGINESLSVWNYADNFDSGLQIADGDWLKSNSQEVLDRTLAITSELAPQFKGQFKFYVDKTLPMPTYSVPGLDII